MTFMFSIKMTLVGRLHLDRRATNNLIGSINSSFFVMDMSLSGTMEKTPKELFLQEMVVSEGYEAFEAVMVSLPTRCGSSLLTP